MLHQALSLDLYRSIDQYDFIGDMDQDFYYDLEKMANQYGGPLLPMLLDESFGYQKYTSRSKGMINKHENIGISDMDDGICAPAKVEQFYSTQSVRRIGNIC